MVAYVTMELQINR
ncbi:hypothetical protein EC960109_1439A, partial [Escherichia coli 96.0109]